MQHQLALEERRQKGSEYALVSTSCCSLYTAVDTEKGKPAAWSGNSLWKNYEHSLGPATLLDHIMQESQEQKRQHGAELQQAQLEQAPVQAGFCGIALEQVETCSFKQTANLYTMIILTRCCAR